VVQREGNLLARQTIGQVFEISDRDWRGIGTIPMSGYEVNGNFASYDARRKFKLNLRPVEENKECIAGAILKGLKKPFQCPNFGTKCTPEHPLGAPMVSSEGACAAYYQWQGH
jgi:hydrogenase expression/formation protein HypD